MNARQLTEELDFEQMQLQPMTVLKSDDVRTLLPFGIRLLDLRRKPRRVRDEGSCLRRKWRRDRDQAQNDASPNHG